MRYSEIRLSEQQINEIRMNLSALRQQAAGINALAGMEFEMCVPGVSDPEDATLEPDYSVDENPRDIDDIVTFFSNGDYGLSSREGRGLSRRLEREFDEWLQEKIQDDWDSDAGEYIDNYISNNYSQEEIDDPDFDRDYAADQAYDEYHDNYEVSQRDWLRYRGLFTMQDVAGEYDLSWPYLTQSSNDNDISIEDLSKDFSREIGRPATWSNDYHGAQRSPGTYAVEPDGSIEAPNGYAGIEFVSPPLPVTEILSDLRKVREWAGMTGCETNKSTGLHINVSIPGRSMANLDYVKLALLLGDEYVLQEFGRSANFYAKSALKIVKDRVSAQSADVLAMIQQMKSRLGDLASKAIHSGNTDKYTSINTKEGYVEFRSAGGDWLSENFEKLEATLLRFVVALDAATDPQKYRQEYLKKLYKLLNATGDTDPITYFAKYVAGELPKDQLKSMIQSLQLSRQIAKEPPSARGASDFWWNVTMTGQNASIEVVANSRALAINKARQEWGIPPGNVPDSMFQARPLRRHGGSSYTGDWGLWSKFAQAFARMSNNPGSALRRFQTQQQGQEWLSNIGLDPAKFDILPIPANYGQGS